MKIGLVLPHFGKHCTYERVFGQIGYIEKAGFHSVWVRDHLSFQPGAFEEKSTLFLEPFTTLAAIAAKTERLMLGTATLVTYRHPLVASALFGTLAYIAKGRIVAGIGAGTHRATFDAVGLPFEKRGKIVEEMLDILRLTWATDHVSYHGEFYRFDDVTIDPKPPSGTPLYYGGVSLAAIRRSVTHCEGWLPFRIPLKVLDRLIASLRERENKEQKQKRTTICYSPLLSISRKSERAKSRIGIESILGNLSRSIQENKWQGISATEENLEGMIVMGTPQECVDQMARFQEREIDEILLHLGNTYDEWETALELLSTEVLPHFRE
jgi:alkanesulfonate monooxygenase SsuD/methylene tetrahydromethanopterin reductase-like flavin-dependent oxidoreductase (luciferase family)